MLVSWGERANDPLLVAVSQLMGNSPGPYELKTGVYQIGHFGHSHFLPDYESYPDLSGEEGCYGVCDSVEQILETFPELVTSERQFTITVTPIRKASQPSEGGWRWHKWGPYIGKQSPQCEYLRDEPKIDKVYVYHVYEKKVPVQPEVGR